MMVTMPRFTEGRTRAKQEACGLVSERGFALPVAIAVLMMLGLLVGAAITIATQTSASTTRDTRTKSALEAAEAGLQVATYRLTQLNPAASQCIGVTSGASVNEAPKSGTSCESPSEALGNGATFRYWTTLPLAVGGTCAGQTVKEIKTGRVLRCVTSEGTVGGVSQRLSTLVESAAGASLFSVEGILGLSEIKISGSVKIPGVVASNEKIIGEGSAAFERGYELCPPKGTFTPAAGKERNRTGVTVGGVGGTLSNPSLEKTRTECPVSAAVPINHATATNNEDSRIGVQDEFYTEGKSVNKFTGSPNYELFISSNGKLTLSGSKYYLCKFEATNNSTLRIAATAKVEIYIDSPEAEGSKCPKGTGQFQAGGSFVVENLSHNPANLLISMAGAGPFKFENGNGKCSPYACFEASVMAPKAEVLMNGGTSFKGGIVGNKVHLENGAGIFEWASTEGELTNGAFTGYARRAWEQCTPGSGASEGC